MKIYNLRLQGLPPLDKGFILAMLSLNAQKRLDPPWRVTEAEAPHAVLFDLSDAEAFLAWSTALANEVPVPIACAEEQPVETPWFLEKPLRSQQLIEVLNAIAVRCQQLTTPEITTLEPRSTIPSVLEQPLLRRLTSVVERQATVGPNKRDMKLVFAGTMGAGKSTAIGTISEIKPIRTEARATDEVARRKELTTVAMDYGELTLANQRKLRLYGAPGQGRYDFMSNILRQGALGLILLVDNCLSNPFSDMDYYLDLFTDLIRETALVVGVTHMDLSLDPPLDRYVTHLNSRGFSAPVFAIDARDKKDVSKLIEALVTQLEPAV